MKKIIQDYKIPENQNFGVEIECGTNKNCNCDIHENEHKFSYECLKSIFLKEKIKCYVPEDDMRENYNKTFWHIGSDGSIRNLNWTVEIRSPILTGESGLDKVLKVIDILVNLGFEVNASCGFHVHFDASKIKIENLKSLIYLYSIFEKCINKITAKERENCRHSRSMDFTEIVGPRGGNKRISKKETLDRLESCENIDQIIDLYPSRYKKINVTAIQKFNTIEFRQHQGDFNKNRIIRWIRFLSLIIKFTEKNNVLNDKNNLLKFLDNNDILVADLEKYINYKIIIPKKK